MGSIPTTRDGYERLRAEIERLETIELPKLAHAVSQARAEGDLSENAEYHGQRENMGLLQARIDSLKAKLSQTYIVEGNNRPKEAVQFGATVTLKDLDADLDEKYMLVGPGEEDYSGEVLKILCMSPLAQQLLHHKAGDQVEVDTPGGTVRYVILAIE